jgi:hypothetical protein
VLAPDPRRVPVDVPDERLVAAVDDLHGPVGVQGQHRRVDLHRQVLTAAERPADAREVEAHLLGLQVEARRHLVAVDVEPLRGHVDVDATLAVGDGEARFGPQERLVLHPDLVEAADGDIALRVGVAVPDHEVADDVRTVVLAVAVAGGPALLVDRRLLQRPLHVDDRLERLVLDHDPLRRTPRLLGVLGRHERDRLADVAHAVECQHRLVGELEPVPLRPRHVVVGQHRVDARHRHGLRDVDQVDACMRVRAAQRPAPEHPGGPEIGGVGELAGRLRRPVGAEDEVADPTDAELSSRGRAHDAAAAALTASKIFA